MLLRVSIIYPVKIRGRKEMINHYVIQLGQEVLMINTLEVEKQIMLKFCSQVQCWLSDFNTLSVVNFQNN